MTFRLHFNSSRLKVLKFHSEPVIFTCLMFELCTSGTQVVFNVKCGPNCQTKITDFLAIIRISIRKIRTKLRQGNIFTPVCQSFRSQGAYSTHPCIPPGRNPSWSDTPPRPVHAGIHPPRNACWDTVNKRAVRILLECILVFFNSISTLISMYLLLREHQ